MTPTNLSPNSATKSADTDDKAAKLIDQKNSALRAGAQLRRKKGRTALEDRLAADPWRSVELCRWARLQNEHYRSGLLTWYSHRNEYMSEAMDIFKHRENGGKSESRGEQKLVFALENDSLNVVAAIAEFAAAQAEMDIYGGEPWFSASPVGINDEKLAERLQRHLQWKLRDGRLVTAFSSHIPIAAYCGEVFTKTLFRTEIDEYEEEQTVLMANGKPVEIDGKVISNRMGQEEILAMVQSAGIKGKFSWGTAYVKRSLIMRDGVESVQLHHNDVSFREDATELCLSQTSFYNNIEMSVAKARKLFNLSKVDAIRLALAAGWQSDRPWTPGENDHIIDSNDTFQADSLPFGQDADEMLLNSRVRLTEGWVRMDPFGDGVERSMYIVFPPNHEDWLVYAQYLGNLSPKAALNVHCHAWEQKPGRLYGRGFFEKYGSYQTYIDNLWNQIGYRNRMHSNPVTGYKPNKLVRDEDDKSDLQIQPGMMLELRPDADLSDALQFLEMPDLDNRSMELMQLALQMMQMRSGITAASQGDMTGLPENNTATGIRQLMSRAAVLLKKPIRNIRRSLGREFSLAVKFIYSNMDTAETFLWAEGSAPELVSLTPQDVENLDIDVNMLLTQEQNQNKLESAKYAIEMFMQWIMVPEVEKPQARVLFLQAVKALDFDQAERLLREAAPTLQDAITLLPEDQQPQAIAIMQAGMQVLAAQEQAQQPAAPTQPEQAPPPA